VVDRAISGAVAATGGAVVTVTGTFLPWLRSGTRNRSSYAIFDLVERLGFAPGGVVSWSLRLWPLVPLLLVGVTIGGWCVAAHRVSWPSLVAVTVPTILWVGGTAIAILTAPDVALFRIGSGPTVTLFGVLLLAGGVVALRRPGSAASGAS